MGCVQPIYATPPGYTRHLERAAIHTLVKAGNDWLQTHDGGRRIRICGKIVVFKTPARYTVTPELVWTFDKLLPEPADRINLVFYDAPDTLTGGWADQPPLVPGHTALISLGWMPPWVDTWRFYLLHELLHTFGIGHVLDDPYDLMAPQWASLRLHLDPSRTHYWAQLQASPFLTQP